MAQRRFEYRGGDRTAEDVSRRRGRGGYDSYIDGEFTIIKVGEGEHSFRILPPTWDTKSDWGNGWEIKIYLHYSIGPDKGTYLCPDKMKGEPCPICEARVQAEDDDERRAFRAAETALCWVIDRDKESAGPQIWRLPISLFNDILGRAVDKKTNKPILLDDPENGYDIIFTREGGDERTKYVGVEVSRDSTPIAESEKQQDRWLDYIQDNPLPDLLKFYDYEYLEKMLMGGSAKDADNAEPRGRGERVRSRRSEPEPEPETRRGRGRTAEPEPEPEPETRRGRGRTAEPEPEPEPETRRGRGRAVEDAGNVDDEPPSRGRGRQSSSRDVEDAAVEERRGRGRGREPLQEPDEDPPGERGGRNGGSATRRGREPEPEPENDDPPPRRGGRGRADPEEDPPPPTERARASLDRMRSRRAE